MLNTRQQTFIEHHLWFRRHFSVIRTHPSWWFGNSHKSSTDKAFSMWFTDTKCVSIQNENYWKCSLIDWSIERCSKRMNECIDVWISIALKHKWRRISIGPTKSTKKCYNTFFQSSQSLLVGWNLPTKCMYAIKTNGITQTADTNKFVKHHAFVYIENFGWWFHYGTVANGFDFISVYSPKYVFFLSRNSASVCVVCILLEQRVQSRLFIC